MGKLSRRVLTTVASLKEAGYKPGDEVARACPHDSLPMNWNYDGKKSWLECPEGHKVALEAESKEDEGVAGQTNMSMEDGGGITDVKVEKAEKKSSLSRRK